MKKGILKLGFLLLTAGLLLSCFKDQDDEVSLLGSWIETAPLPGRTGVYFKDESNLRIFKSNGHLQTFRYRLQDETLILKPKKGGGEGKEYFFRQIDENRFKMGDIYYSGEQDSIKVIIFERELQ